MNSYTLSSLIDLNELAAADKLTLAQAASLNGAVDG
jgi:hypothetical protein